MSSPHHHHRHHPPPPPPPPQSHHNNHHCSSCCCCSSPNSAAPPSQIPSNSSDQLLLQALSAHILIQSQSPPPQPQHHFFLKPQCHTNISNPLRHHRTRHHHQQQRSKDDDDDEEDPSSPLLLRSLIRRVSALESSLSNLSSSPPPNPPRPHQKQPPPPPSSRSHSLKHVAAATIQRHFRRYLARRSRTLRDLKRLASIKSHAAVLKSALADKSLKNPRALSQKAMDLLFQLDSIQSSDPMTREGKRSISRELVRISEFVGKVLIREREEEVDDLVKRRERARRVSFVQNGDEAKLFDDLSERNSEEEETYSRDRGFYDRFSDGDDSPKVIRHQDGVNGGSRGSNGSSGLAAPLPLKMESRRSEDGFKKKVAIED